MSAPDEISVGRLAVAHGLLSPQAFQRAFAQWRQQSEAGKADEGFGGFLESRGLLAPGEWEQLVHDAGREVRPVSDADLNLIPQNGDQVGPYLLEARIARGGMGVIYRARKEPQGQIVALKILAPDGPPLPEDTKRFEREAQAVRRLQHPNIVCVHDAGFDNGVFFITMDFVDGKSLAALLEDREFTETQALGLVACLAEALQHAHDAGVIHRDIKPANIVIDRQGKPWVLDFGVAKILGSGGISLTLPGTTVGTPAYMSPEQAMGRSEVIGPAADIYSLGAVLYELLTAHPPYEGPNPVRVMQEVVDHDPPPPRDLAPDISRQAEAICQKAMRRDPADRFASGAALAQACMDVQTGSVGFPAEEVREEAADQPVAASGNRLLLVVVALAVAGLAALVLWR